MDATSISGWSKHKVNDIKSDIIHPACFQPGDVLLCNIHTFKSFIAHVKTPETKTQFQVKRLDAGGTELKIKHMGQQQTRNQIKIIK